MFSVIETRDGVQTAEMRLRKGEESGPFGNEHADSAQILFVHSGAVDAEVGDRRFRLRAGESAVVSKNMPHRFIGASEEVAVTFNVYAPPAY